MGAIDKLKRDIQFVVSARRVLRSIAHNTPDSPRTTADILEKWADKSPDNIALYFEDRQITYRQFNETANRYARWALDQGVRRGETVALMMDNRPEYLMAWFGMAKAGTVTALINTHLQSRALGHCLNIVDAQHLILGAENVEAYESARAYLKNSMTEWVTGPRPPGGPCARDLDEALARQSPGTLPSTLRDGMVANDPCLYIFTSGTTGLPKAARLNHVRISNIMFSFAAAVKAGPDDRMYLALPLYHSSGGLVAVGAALSVGGSVIIKQKFSVSEFWSDCVRYRETMFQYIGEMCRWLLNAPETESEDQHMIRVCIGNGLRPEIWERFQERFHLPWILEFYGSTEGNIALFNYDGKPGSVGRIPGFLSNSYRYTLVKFDVETQQPLRGADGFCIAAPPGEIGEILGEIDDEPRRRFAGYVTRQETEKKILTNVYKQGDKWFRSGDLMRQDEEGYYYFVDRIGDTFRWKGENVSTTEVTEVISVFPGVLEVNVYGVAVPHMDGRAGMAAIVCNDQFDLQALHAYLSRELPDYARPLFIRVLSKIETTGTFKHRKVDLTKEGFDPGCCPDALYFDNPETGSYARLDAGIFERIVNRGFRL